jgi:hypothetical protein
MYFGAGSMCYSLRDEMNTVVNVTCSCGVVWCGVVCYRYISIVDSCIQLLGACPLQSVAGYSPRRFGFIPSGVDTEFLVDKVTSEHLFLSVFRSPPTSFDSTKARSSTIIHRMGNGPIRH